jgi:hypothetical protein
VSVGKGLKDCNGSKDSGDGEEITISWLAFVDLVYLPI